MSFYGIKNSIATNTVIDQLSCLNNIDNQEGISYINYIYPKFAYLQAYKL